MPGAELIYTEDPESLSDADLIILPGTKNTIKDLLWLREKGMEEAILDMAGNVGTQSLAVTIRVLMDETLTFRQKIKLVVKEIRVGLSNGLLLGVLSFILIGLYIMIFKQKELLFSFAVSGCIGISLLLAMLISSAVGTLIPLFFKKIKIDPAVASGPLITTINDLVAVV